MLPWLFWLEIVVFEMFLFNEITGSFSKQEEKNRAIFQEPMEGGEFGE